MKIAIASTGKTTAAKIDKHFARCMYFGLYDTKTCDVDFIKNICRTMESNAGISVVECIRNMGAEKVISGEFGLKAKAELDKYSIQMIVITDPEKTIREIIELLKINQQ
jgi:predicted Fe-Mo cluster-binding NifX family protein